MSIRPCIEVLPRGCLRYQNFRGELACADALVKLSCNPLYISVLPWCTFLTVLPIKLRLVDRRDVCDVVAFVGKVLGSRGKELRKVIKTVCLKVARQLLPVGVSFSCLCIIDWRGIGEKDKVLYAIFLCLAHEPLLPVAPGPVVCPVLINEAFCAMCLFFDVAVGTLRS